jgi:hypothetical protein
MVASRRHGRAFALALGLVATSATGARPWWDDDRPPYPPASEWTTPLAQGRFLWHSPDGELWGMFVFGGSPRVLERWSKRMDGWAERMERGADHGQGFGPRNDPRGSYEPWLDPGLAPWLRRWEAWPPSPGGDAPPPMDWAWGYP